MKNRIVRGIVVLGVTMIVGSAVAPDAFAQGPLQVSDLTLKKTYVVTRTTPQSIDGPNWGGTELFALAGVIVNCPKGGGSTCLLKVDVALQAWVNVAESLNLYARVDYHDSASQIARVISAVIPNNFSETRSNTWLFEVPPGDHVVEAFAWTLNDLGATMEHGSITISVFK